MDCLTDIAMSLDDHKHIIEKLIPLHDSEDFDGMLDFLMEKDAPSVRLLVKIEIKRLMSLCHKKVDLRGRVSGQCREYTLHGNTHWLDDVAYNLYLRRIKFYGYQFREGLYQELLNTRNNFRVMHQHEVISTDSNQHHLCADNDTLVATKVQFGSYLQRSENRLYVATPIEIMLPFKQKVNGKTQDLSPSGGKFKVPASFNYILGQTVTVTFPKLAQSAAQADLAEGIPYRILGIDPCDNDGECWLRVKALQGMDIIRLAIDKVTEKTASRLKRNIDDIAHQARTRGYENCYLKHTTTLPVYLAQQDIAHILLTTQNQHIWQYWHDERNLPVLQHLLSPQRMKLLGKPGLTQSSTLIYSFAHTHNSKHFFYSAALSEMDSEQRRLFWLLGSKRPSWRVFRVSVYPLLEQDYQRMDSVAPDLNGEFTRLSHVAMIEDLTTTQGQQDYQATAKPTIGAKALNRYLHPRETLSQDLCRYFDPRPQRGEHRYQFRTALTLHYADNQSLKTHTADISSQGINIVLPHPIALTRDEKVRVSLTELSKSSAGNLLHKVPYRCVRISRDGRSMTLATLDDAHKGIRFLARLLEKNHDKLQLIEENISHKTLLLALYQALLSRLSCLPFFAERAQHRLNLRAIGHNLPLRGLGKKIAELSLSAGGNAEHYNLDPLFKGYIKPLLTDPLRFIEPVRSRSNDIYLHLDKQDGEIVSSHVKLATAFNSIEQRIEFIQQAQKAGGFIALRISAVPMKSALTLLTSDLLTELSRQTLHRAQQLENEFNALMGCGEIVDISEEVLTRLHLNSR
ncbi:PilZ domain-containing protein [Thaumasiovibrio sp. DFM-14]|uniref:PilZ domain-containing protein n=1 Tax=Thaumasiovibrio sp. DFM-14 TaxID=3384792 RepID=UPI0039A116B2